MHLREVVPGVHVHDRERERRGPERLLGQAQQHDRVLAAGEQQHGALELGRDLAHHVHGLGLQLAQLGEGGGGRSPYGRPCTIASARFHDDLPPDHPRRPRLRVLPGRGREGGGGGGRRPALRGRRVPRARPLHGRAHRARLRDAQPRRPRVRPRAAGGGDRRHDPHPPRRGAGLRPRAVRRRRRMGAGRLADPRAAHARPPARAHRLRADRRPARRRAVGGADRGHAVRQRRRAARPRDREVRGRARDLPLAARAAALAARRTWRSGPATSAARCAAVPGWT